MISVKPSTHNKIPENELRIETGYQLGDITLDANMMCKIALYYEAALVEEYLYENYNNPLKDLKKLANETVIIRREAEKQDNLLSEYEAIKLAANELGIALEEKEQELEY